MLLFAIGCGSDTATTDSKAVGEWKASFVLDNGKKLPGANLRLDKDLTFRELYANTEMTGIWSQSGSDVTLKVKEIGRTPILEAKRKMLALAKEKHNDVMLKMAEGLEKPITITLSADAKTMVAKQDDPAGGHAVYTRQ